MQGCAESSFVSIINWWMLDFYILLLALSNSAFHSIQRKTPTVMRIADLIEHYTKQVLNKITQNSTSKAACFNIQVKTKDLFQWFGLFAFLHSLLCTCHLSASLLSCKRRLLLQTSAMSLSLSYLNLLLRLAALR